MNTAEIERLLTQLEDDPAKGVELLEKYAPMVADTLAVKVWAEAHECGESDGRDADHPQYTGCHNTPYEDSLLRRNVDKRFLGIVEVDDDTRLVILKGNHPFDGAILREAMWREHMSDVDWKWTADTRRDLAPGEPTEPGALVTLDGRVWVDVAFTDATPDHRVVVTTLTRRRQPAWFTPPRPQEPSRLGRISGRF